MKTYKIFSSKLMIFSQTLNRFQTKSLLNFCNIINQNNNKKSFKQINNCKLN